MFSWLRSIIGRAPVGPVSPEAQLSTLIDELRERRAFLRESMAPLLFAADQEGEQQEAVRAAIERSKRGLVDLKQRISAVEALRTHLNAETAKNEAARALEDGRMSAAAVEAHPAVQNARRALEEAYAETEIRESVRGLVQVQR